MNYMIIIICGNLYMGVIHYKIETIEFISELNKVMKKNHFLHDICTNHRIIIIIIIIACQFGCFRLF